MDNLFIWAPVAGVLALLFATYLGIKVVRADAGNERMQEIMHAIHEGSQAFLMREYKMLLIFIAAVFALLGFFIGLPTGVAFLCGAFCSMLAGYIGMQIATAANARVAQAAQTSQNKALGVAFSGGAVMGMCVVGLGIIGLSVVYLIFRDPVIVTGFGFGASSIALFARVGGGIYTKAADVGADLVGKVEAGIPEDDPRNPAVIADNVGDNVGDVAGMGADLFESYVGAIISGMAIGITVFGIKGVIAPLLLAAIGIVASIIGCFFVRTGEGANPQKALKNGTYASSALMIAGAYIVCAYYLGEIGPFWAIISGLLAGIAIGQITEYYTSGDFKPVKGIAKSASTGPATVIISGFSVGMKSTVAPIICIVIAILISFHFAGLFGIALAAIGMLATSGMVVAIDTYGPIADNAGGIAEMAELDPSVRQVTDKLDAVGNTTAAIGKGFAIGSAALTALALFSAFASATDLHASGLSLLDPNVIAGLFIGGMLPFLFGALTMEAVGVAAFAMVEEVRRQFRDIPGIMEGTTKPDDKTCVDISTKSSLQKMVLPGLIAVITPVAIGLLLGKSALAGLLAGALVTGVLVAIMMANAGGAWDNAKKFIESGEMGGKGSDAHKAAVVGDTVGDPFKDTSGPAMNILIKLMTIVSLVCAPLFMM